MNPYRIAAPAPPPPTNPREPSPINALRWLIIGVFSVFAAFNFAEAALSSRPDTDIPLSFGIAYVVIVITAAAKLR